MTAIWTCLIGHRGIDRDNLDVLPPGSDAPMRQAVADAFKTITGRDEEFIFSGWGQTYLPESYAAVVDDRNLLLDDTHHAAWIEARDLVALAIGDEPDSDDERTTAAVTALTELIWHRRRNAVPDDSTDPAFDLAYWAWTIIANVSEGDWSQQPAAWQDAAARWRDDFHAALDPAPTP